MSPGASVGPSVASSVHNGNPAVYINSKGKRAIKKVVEVKEKDPDPIVRFFEWIGFDKLCGVNFEEDRNRVKFVVVEEEIQEEPLTPMIHKLGGSVKQYAQGLFKENNYPDPFQGGHQDMSICGV
jgi:hypothetical protein